MDTENQYRGLTSTPNAKYLGKNLIGAFLILIVSLLMILIILAPEVTELFRFAVSSRGILAWTIALGSLFLVGFLIVFPVFLIVQGFIDHRNARDLDRIGILTKGSIAEKWVDESENIPIYHVRYKYFLDINALQIVNEDVFQKLKCDQSIDVLHLKHTPHVSRLDLDSQQKFSESTL